MEKIIHQIWVGDFNIPEREKKFSNNLRELHKDYKYIFWTNEPELPYNVKLVYDNFYKNKDYVFCADLLRIWVVYEFGGMYLDIDFDIQKNLNPLFEHDSVLFYHNDLDHTIPNNLIGATKGSAILKHCLDSVNESCYWYGPSWFGETIKNYLKLPYKASQIDVEKSLSEHKIHYHKYSNFENQYGKHLSLFSWKPETLEKLKKNHQ
jgi:mannosyltransferase OCH1-like enzyme